MSTFREGLQALIQSGKDLPTLPTVVFQLSKALADENVGGQQIAAIIERDVALTTRVLRVANSSAFAGADRISSISAAVNRLGMKQVQRLCVVQAVVQAFESRQRGLDYKQFWVHSAAVGILAEQLWLRLGEVSSTLPDDVYVAGLLHDVGILVLDQFFPSEYQQIASQLSALARPRSEVEREHLDTDHGAIGGLLLSRWTLPEVVADAVAFHHQVDMIPEDSRTPCLCVAAAEAVCADRGLGLADEGSGGPSAEVALASLGLSPGDVAEVLAEVPSIGERAQRVLS